MHDQTPWNATTGIQQNLDWLKRIISDMQGRYEKSREFGRDLATAAESYFAAKENSKRRRMDPKWEDSLRKAISEYRSAESGQFGP